MSILTSLRSPDQQPSLYKPQRRDRMAMLLVALLVIGNGLVTVASTLMAQLHIRNGSHINELIISIPLLSGLTLVYLGAQLRRRKRIAWMVLIPVYSFILGNNLSQFRILDHHHAANFWFVGLILPSAVLAVLVVFGKLYNVKSNVQNFRFAVFGIVLTLAVALLYGVSGFLLLDKSDFHQEISWIEAVHRTIDQFDLTTDHQLVPHTKRAVIFLDSLSIVSTIAVGYAAISLFQPFRARHTDQTANRREVSRLLADGPGNSEDYFKLWPRDKMYFLLHNSGVPVAALAYHVQKGVALVAGEPVGPKRYFKPLMAEFEEMCRYNDWLPALIHISGQHRAMLKASHFQMQMIGQEAIVSVDDFLDTTVKNKYFRQIVNKFNRQNYHSDWLEPPHSQPELERLQQVSSQWLSLPGRQERGFMMGYFSQQYMQQCRILVVKDQDETIQAFMNQLPASQTQQISYDLLRHATGSLGNINDYLMIQFITEAAQQGFKEVNLGLCPLSGLETEEKDKSLIDTTLRFVYANGDRFYSFSGLQRYKSKYQPQWQPRYIAYKGGLRGFSRTALALNKAMSRLH